MSYKVNRALGYQRWGVTNPWVFADYGKPQRRRGYVSPVVFQTGQPAMRHAGAKLVRAQTPHPLGQTEVETELLRRAEEDLKRGERMERYALIGVTVSVISALMMYNRLYGSKKVTANRRRRRRSPRRRR